MRILALACGAWIAAMPGNARAAGEVEAGMARAEVIALKGQPRAALSRGAEEILLFEDGRVTLRNGTVAATERKRIPPRGTTGAPGAAVARRNDSPPAAATPLPEPAAVRPAPGPGGGWTGWETDFAKASAAAATSQRYLLLDFTGSDWCGWCKKLDSEVFSQGAFQTFAADKLVCVKLDFPRRTGLSATLKAQNTELAQKYGVRSYPTVVVLSPQGEEVGRQRGYGSDAQPYLESLKTIVTEAERKRDK